MQKKPAGILIALLLLASTIASGLSSATNPASVTFRIEINLDPNMGLTLPPDKEDFTLPDAPLSLYALSEHAHFAPVPAAEPFLAPMQENLPALWLPLKLYRRTTRAGPQAVPNATLLVHSPRLRLLPTSSAYVYPVLLEYLGPGRMNAPLMIPAGPPSTDYNFRNLIISFKRFTTEGGDLPASLVITGEVSVPEHSGTD